MEEENFLGVANFHGGARLTSSFANIAYMYFQNPPIMIRSANGATIENAKSGYLAALHNYAAFRCPRCYRLQHASYLQRASL